MAEDEMSIGELQRILLDKLGVLLSPVESAALLRVLDEDCNGSVSYGLYSLGLHSHALHSYGLCSYGHVIVAYSI